MKCSQCGQEVQVRAVKCQKCGLMIPVSSAQDNISKRKIFIYRIAIPAVIFIFFSIVFLYIRAYIRNRIKQEVDPGIQGLTTFVPTYVMVIDLLIGFLAVISLLVTLNGVWVLLKESHNKNFRSTNLKKN